MVQSSGFQGRAWWAQLYLTAWTFWTNRLICSTTPLEWFSHTFQTAWIDRRAAYATVSWMKSIQSGPFFQEHTWCRKNAFKEEFGRALVPLYHLDPLLMPFRLLNWNDIQNNVVNASNLHNMTFEYKWNDNKSELWASPVGRRAETNESNDISFIWRSIGTPNVEKAPSLVSLVAILNSRTMDEAQHVSFNVNLTEHFWKFFI